MDATRKFCHKWLELKGYASALLDGELQPPQRSELEGHLEQCASCHAQFEELRALSAWLQPEKKLSVSPDWNTLWYKVAASITPKSKPAALFWKRFCASPAFAMAAGLVIFLSSFLLTKDYLLKDEPPASASSQVIELYAKTSAADSSRFLKQLSRYAAVESSSEGVVKQVAFAPLIRENLPGGFKLDRMYLVGSRCCNGVHFRYLKGSEVVALLQQAPGHPLEWNRAPLKNVTIAGVPCRKAEYKGSEVVQIDPQRRNVTVISKKGALDWNTVVASLANGRT